MARKWWYFVGGLVLAALTVTACDKGKSTAKEGGWNEPSDGGQPSVKPYSEGVAGGGGIGGSGIGGFSGALNCRRVTVTHEPEWQCTDAQIAEAKASYSGGNRNNYAGGSTQLPADLSADVSLQVRDCDGLAEIRRPELLASYQSSLEANRLSVLGQRCIGKTETYWVDGAGNRNALCNSTAKGGSSAMTGAGGASTSSSNEEQSGANEYSTTNNQVAEVDEADFVKNDSGYVYIASADGLHVIDAWPAADTRKIAKLTLRGEPKRLFLDGNRLVVYTRISDFQRDEKGYAYNSSGNGQCTYGYNCRFSSDGGHTLIIVFDVSDPSAPTELVRYELSGAFVAARRVNHIIYTVVHDGALTAIPGVDTSFSAGDAAAFEAQFAERKKAIESAVAAVPANLFIPWLSEQAKASQTRQYLDSCDNALAGATAKGTNFMSLVAIDLETLARPTRTIVAAKPGFVYAATGALYVAVDGTEGGDYSVRGSSGNDASTIHKISLNGLDTSYLGSQAIRGHVLNQFSMDEYQGVLRVATSDGWVPDPNVSSSIATIGEVGGKLTRLGELTGLAPSEDIRAVRFDGDRGFVVTFKKTDPLFVINLVDPAKPSVLGELKIPGFSTYMHRLDANHLLAVGFDADDMGSYAYFDGIQIQIFDVTSLSDPRLLHKVVIGTRGSGSEALMDHLAFNYFASRGLLALPLTVCEGGGNGKFGDTLTFSGLMVFNISLQAGITELGRMPFVAADAGAGSGATCGTWWSNSTSLVKRSIFMDDYAYGISDTQLKVAPLSDLDGVLQSVNL